MAVAASGLYGNGEPWRAADVVNLPACEVADPPMVQNIGVLRWDRRPLRYLLIDLQFMVG